MQSDNNETVLVEAKEAKAFRNFFNRSVQAIWNMLYKIYSVVKRCFDALCPTDFQRKIIQYVMDLLLLAAAIYTVYGFTVACGVWIKCHGTVKAVWNMINLRIYSACKLAKRYLDPLLTAYIDHRKIMQDKLDRLSNHSSAGYVLVTIVNLAAVILKSAVVFACVYYFIPYLWMMMEFLIDSSYVIGRGTAKMFAVMAAVMKFIVTTILRLTSTILVGLTRIVIYAVTQMVPNTLNGAFHVSKLLITPITTSPVFVLRKDWRFLLQSCFLCGVIVTLMLLVWRRLRRVVNASDESKYQSINVLLY